MTLPAGMTPAAATAGFEHRFEAIGTHWSIKTPAALPADLLDLIDQRIEAFDLAYSRFRPDSLISRFATAGGVCELPDDAPALFALYRSLYECTGGLVTPLVGNALEHLGYDAGYSLSRRKGPASVPDWDDVLTVQGSVLTASRPVLLDVGAAGKGYLVDHLAEILDEAGWNEYLIDGGGDIVHSGSDLCRVGLEDPADPGKVVGVANLRNGALCGSATNRRTWGAGLHHIIDPSTGEPATGVVATWAVADSAMVADGLATALFLADPADLAGHFTFGYVRIFPGGAAEYSGNFDGELFT